jgi:hypothetical protein
MGLAERASSVIVYVYIVQSTNRAVGIAGPSNVFEVVIVDRVVVVVLVTKSTFTA